MSFRPSSLRAFLAAAKSTLHAAKSQKQPITLVFGNESADLDSITSSVLYAYLRSSLSPYSSLHVPVLNIPQADIALRPELLALLPHANLEVSHFLTATDVESTEIDADAVLTDHNAPAGPLTRFAQRVTGCVDHHKDERVLPANIKPRLIQSIGSCTSLVVTFLQPAWDALTLSASSSSRNPGGQDDTTVGVEDMPVRRTWDTQVAKFALAAILIDTNDLKDPGKTTAADKDAVTYLMGKIQSTDPAFDRSKFHKDISNAKSKLDDLTINEILRKDYKEWNGLGVSSSVKNVEWLAKHASEKQGAKLGQVLESFKAERSLKSLVLMTAFADENEIFHRELVILGPLQERMAGKATSELQLEEWTGTADLGQAKAWWQKDTGKSRKQVAPLLRGML